VLTVLSGLAFKLSRLNTAVRRIKYLLFELNMELKAIDITRENFAPFGFLIEPQEDGEEFSPEILCENAKDASVDLSKGTPRFYIMRLRDRKLEFDRITFHRNVTQCLGAVSNVDAWYLAVAKPTMSVERFPKIEDINGENQDVTVFRIPHGVYVKLHAGTWHAGPLWDSGAAGAPSYVDFGNLELADTNVVDHNTHVYEEYIRVLPVTGH